MSEAKVCKVCGREDCGVARFGAGTSVASAHVRYILGYERERAAREKAEADLAQARKELAEARAGGSVLGASKAAYAALEDLPALLEERRALIAFVEAVAEYDEYRDDDEDPAQILARIGARARAALALAARKVGEG